MFTKQCTRCHETKPLDAFDKDKRQKFGRRPECKLCNSKRGAHALKSIRFRVKNLPKYYGDIPVSITAEEIESIPDICFFCGQQLLDKKVLHRKIGQLGYVPGNVVKAHKSCHAKYHYDLRT